jgi:hypothetical protein
MRQYYHLMPLYYLTLSCGSTTAYRLMPLYSLTLSCGSTTA